MMAAAEWTLQDAQAATEAALAADPARSSGDPTLPVFQWATAQEVDALRAVIEGGDGFALLGAVRKCANHGIPMPEWLAKQFIRRYDRVLACRLGSWDDAFGRPYPKGKHLNALRKQREKRFAVYNAVRAAKASDPKIAIDAILFEKVGDSLGIGKTLAETLYYQAKRMMPVRE